LKKKKLFKSKIKKDDIVIMISGKDKGKQGIVLKTVKKYGINKLLIEGINVKSKNVKANPQQQKKAGVIKKECLVDASNASIFNKRTLKKDKICYTNVNNKKKRIFSSDKQEIIYKG